MLRFWNFLVELILKSPFHRLLSYNLTLITVTGRKTGQRYTTPVGYYWQDEQHLDILTHPQRQWWRNLQGNTFVNLRLLGRNIRALATAIDDPQVVATALIRDRHLSPEKADQAAPGWVLIKVTLP